MGKQVLLLWYDRNSEICVRASVRLSVLQFNSLEFIHLFHYPVIFFLTRTLKWTKHMMKKVYLSSHSVKKVWFYNQKLASKVYLLLNDIPLYLPALSYSVWMLLFSLVACATLASRSEPGLELLRFPRRKR